MIQTESADSVHTGILQVWPDTYPSWLLGWDLGTKLGKKGNHNKCVAAICTSTHVLQFAKIVPLSFRHSYSIKHLIILCKNLCIMSY